MNYCPFTIAEIEGKLENELGYRFHPEFWGQGLATEAAYACLYYAFNQLKLDYLLGIVEPENHPSIKVLEKIGMEFVKQSNSVWDGKIVHVYKAMG